MKKRQAELIDLLLSEFKEKKTFNRSDLKNTSDKLKNISDKEFNKLIAIIRSEQLKLGTKLITGFISKFELYKYAIIDIENLGGFKELYRKKRTASFIKNTIPILALILSIISLCILIHVHYIKGSDLELKIENLKNSTLEELKKEEKSQTKISDSSFQIQTDHNQNVIKETEKDSLK